MALRLLGRIGENLINNAFKCDHGDRRPTARWFRVFAACAKRHDQFAWNQPTFLELHDLWVEKFKFAGVAEPVESAGYIFAHLLQKKTFSDVPTNSLGYKLSRAEIWAVDKMCQKRLNCMPVQYVIEQWDFYGMTLKMRPPVFIPRPETESLVDHVFDDVRSRLECSTNVPLKVLEIGCGSGAISLALVRNLGSENVAITAIDAASHAVKLAKENSRLLGLEKTGKLEIFQHTLCGDVESALVGYGLFDVIVSNPPYIPTSDMKELAREISRSLWLEVDPTHPSILSLNPFKELRMVRSYKDIFGKLRFCHLEKASET